MKCFMFSKMIFYLTSTCQIVDFSTFFWIHNWIMKNVIAFLYRWGIAKTLYKHHFCGTRVWIQGLTLAMQTLYHLSCSANKFLCWVFFREVLTFFGLGWPRTMIHPISASWVASIKGVSHRCPSETSNFRYYLQRR
jgi:hypothetical protein